MLSGLYFGSEYPKAAAAGFGDSLLPVEGSGRMKVENAQNSMEKKSFLTFHYALPTYFELGLQLSLQEV